MLSVVRRLDGLLVTWFKFLHRSRTFYFRAVATDGTTHEFEIQASAAQSALDLAQRLCATKGWKLVGRV
jgi:hypothetical protein